MKKLIESTKVKQEIAAQAAKAEAAAASFAYPFYRSLSPAVARTVSLFWSVFGPAARYNFENSSYAYAALMKP